MAFVLSMFSSCSLLLLIFAGRYKEQGGLTVRKLSRFRKVESI